MTTRYPIHTNSLPEPSAPLDLQVRYHMARGRKLQSQVMGAHLAKLWHRLARALPALANGLVRWNLRGATREALMACGDRTLADIGTPREHIALVAKGIDHRDPIAVRQHGWRPRLAAVLQQLSFARPEQRRVLRELSVLSDPELDDIGIHRSNIPQIARTA